MTDPMTAQSNPSLPVPPLKDTCARYLKSLRPLLPPEALAKSELVVREFEKSKLAAKLQTVLEDRAKAEPNWLEEWWEALAYLQPRYGTAIKINPAAAFLLPPAPQLQRAARILHATAEYYTKVITGDLPKESLMKLPLDQFQFQRIFSTWREPQAGMDAIKTTRGATHVVVIVSGRLFKVHILGERADDGTYAIRSVASIHRALHEIMETMARVFDAAGPGHSPGAFTSLDDRDEWAALKGTLREDSLNAASLKAVDDALTVLILERDNVSSHSPSGGEKHGADVAEGDVGSDTELFARCLGGDARSRWFDKLGYIVYRNGICGGNGEHSVADAIVAVIMWSWVCDRVSQAELKADDSFFYTWRSSRRGSSIGPGGVLVTDPSVPAGEPAAVPYELLRWRFDAAMEARMDAAVLDFDERQRRKVDAYVMKFRTFGRRMLRWCKLPPDAFVQMAIQLAHTRATGRERVPVYESAHTRLFHHGRTSTVRSVSAQSADFVAAMAGLTREQLAVPETKARLSEQLVSAMQGHTMLTAEALQALGVDRHLLGLQVAAMLSGEDPAKIPLFADPAYSASGGGGTYVLSTSNVTAGNLDTPRVIGGFMPMVEHGVGVCYYIWNSELHFVITTWKDGTAGCSAKTYAAALRVALNEIMLVFSNAVEQAHWSNL